MEVWKTIPGYSGYSASNKGRIRNDSKNRIISTHVRKSGYVCCNLVRDLDSKWVLRTVHKLVCLAFKGLSPSPAHQVNHIDGNKENNFSNNLEWSTSKENVLHAHKTGLAKYSLPIELENIQTKEVTKFNSKQELSREFNISVSYINKLLYKNNSVLLNGVYKIRPILKDHKPIKFKHAREVAGKDHVTGKIYICENLTLLSFITGLTISTMAKATINNKMVAGWTFLFKEQGWENFTTIDKIDAEKSRVKHFSRKSKDTGLMTKNHTNSEVRTFNTIREASEYTTVNYNSINTLLNKNDLGPIKGFSFKRLSNKSPFPCYDDYQIQASKLERTKSSRPVKVTNVLTGEVTVSGNLKDFCTKNELSPSRANYIANHRPDLTMKGKWKFEWIQL